MKYKRTLWLAALLAFCLQGFAVDGKWRGELKAGLSSIPLVFNFSDNSGEKNCTMDSPAQNAFGIPCAVDYVSSDSVAVTVSGIGASFSGLIGSNEINGTFSQNGYRFPLTLTRERPLIERRPQTPQPPFPYQVIDTLFFSNDNTELHGTLILPESYKKGKTPMCVFVTGSGPENRDEELFEHKPFAVIADYLGRNGVASFRYDDRGVAESKGDYSKASVETTKNDAIAALRFAKSFGTGPTGIIGHSEGGSIGLLLAQEKLPDFVISLAGMAVSGKETLLAQNRNLLVKCGLDSKTIDNSMTLINALFDEIIRQYNRGESTSVDVDAMARELNVTVPPALMASVKKTMAERNDYFNSLVALDVRNGLSKVKCPVLALNGSLDTQVDPKENLDAIRKGVKKAKVIELPELNHLFQHAKTGEVAEYQEIRETISPEVLSIILAFLKEQ